MSLLLDNPRSASAHNRVIIGIKWILKISVYCLLRCFLKLLRYGFLPSSPRREYKVIFKRAKDETISLFFQGLKITFQVGGLVFQTQFFADVLAMDADSARGNIQGRSDGFGGLALPYHGCH